MGVVRLYEPDASAVVLQSGGDGRAAGTVISVVMQVGLGDGSYYKLSYNQWGQVWKVTHYAADSVVGGVPQDSHALSFTRLNLPGSDLSAASPQSDCPRFTEQRTWVENGVMNQSAEVMTSYSDWTPGMASCDVTVLDGTVYKDIYATSGWQKGLTTQSEVRSAGQRKKWTTLSWTQDDLNAPYQINPRVYDTTVNDSDNNRRRTSITYETFTPPTGGSCSLPQEVTEYAADTTTPLRTTRTGYHLSPEYTSRRIIGLPSFQYLYEGTSASGSLRSKVGYEYDDINLPDGYLQSLPTAATQHDGAGYGTTFRWRGNANRMRRYDVTGGGGTYVESQVSYNVTGTVAFSKDAAGHKVTVSYTDSFYQNVNRSNPALQTFAYPTTVTDPDLFTASTWYNYDMGVATETETPKPNGTIDLPGPTQKRLYDKTGRALQVTNSFNAARTKWVYPSAMNLVQSFTQLEVGVEAYTANVLDGAGRVRGTARDLPGSAGGYAGQLFDYDSMGRLARQSNPTETTAPSTTWPATGDDASAGWLYTQHGYDWKGRMISTTNVDGTQSTAGYSGCGRAGGEVATLTDEGTRSADGTLHRRQQRVTSDILGRPVKAETLNWDGSVYSATVTEYDVRDQVEKVKVYQGQATTDGSCPSSMCQQTTTTYDGHGRVWKTRAPSQTADAVFTYNPDDTPHILTDPRGATTTYGYNNNRQLVSGVTFRAPDGITPAPSATFGYDPAGNRTSMIDGLGSVSYNYDPLSRLQSETRQFSDPGPPFLNASFTLTYSYNLADMLKTVTDNTFGTSLTYIYDQAGQLQNLAGSGTTYISGASYRGWGAAKSVSYGNGKEMTATFNSRLQVTRTTVAGVLDRSYEYHDDGRMKYARDFSDSKLDRSFAYDHVGRMSSAFSGFEARAGGQQSEGYGPYHQTYAYDTWGNLTGRTWRSWTRNPFGPGYYPTSNSYSADYTNDRNTNNNGTGQGWVYDAAGNLTQSASGGSTFTYGHNAAGQLIISTSTGRTFQQGYDGNAQVAKIAEGSTPTYYVRSAALGGQVVTELNGSGAKLRGYVYAGAQLVAKQEGSQKQWDHRDGTNTSSRMTNASGTITSKVEQDPLGTKVDDEWSQWGGGTTYNSSPVGFYGDPRNPGMGCSVQNVPTPCNLATRLANSGMYRQSDVVFGNPWSLQNLQLTIGGNQGATETVNFGGHARDHGYLWLSGFGSTNSEYDAGGEFVRTGLSFVPQNTSQEQNPYDNCYQFVDYLVGLASSLDLRSPHTREGKLHNEAAGSGFGTTLLKETYNYKYISYGSEGFKDKLTAGWQDAGVYGHVLLQSGSYIWGYGAGSILAYGMAGYDRFQEGLNQAFGDSLYPHRQNDQRQAEIAGNQAGWEVGRHFWNYITGATPREADRLRNSLKSELCKPDGYRGT